MKLSGKITLATVSVVISSALIGVSVGFADPPSGPTTSTGSASPATSAALQTEINQQLADTHGGVQVAPNVVSYNHDNVRVVFPMPGSTVAVDPFGAGPLTASASRAAMRRGTASAVPLGSTGSCPYGVNTSWSCFYADAGFNGRKLEFKDCDTTQYFSTYNFVNQTSSWVNQKLRATVNVYGDYGAYLWHENPNSSSGYVGNANNDKASFFHIYSNGQCNP